MAVEVLVDLVVADSAADLEVVTDQEAAAALVQVVPDRAEVDPAVGPVGDTAPAPALVPVDTRWVRQPALPVPARVEALWELPVAPGCIRGHRTK